MRNRPRVLDECDLYGGLAGGSLPVESYDMGSGVVFSRTYAHLMAPFMMAFSPTLDAVIRPVFRIVRP